MSYANIEHYGSISPFVKKPFGGISAAALRFFALALMFIDHLWASGISDAIWMTYIGRLAFPIFAFQIAEGFLHSANRKWYALRLLAFGVISEIPFNLFINSTIFYPSYQNVMFTLLFGLVSLVWLEKFKQERSFYTLTISVLVLLGCCLAATIGRTDYGAIGVLMVAAFYLFRRFPCAWLTQLVTMAVLNIYCYKDFGIMMNLFGKDLPFPIQGFAVLALLPIWLYNGKKGCSNKLLQYGAYAFYPVHLLGLFILKF